MYISTVRTRYTISFIVALFATEIEVFDLVRYELYSLIFLVPCHGKPLQIQGGLRGHFHNHRKCKAAFVATFKPTCRQ